MINIIQIPNEDNKICDNQNITWCLVTGMRFSVLSVGWGGSDWLCLDQGLAPAPGNAVMVCCSAGAGGKAAGDTRGGGDTLQSLHTPHCSTAQWPGPGLASAWPESCTVSPSSVPSWGLIRAKPWLPSLNPPVSAWQNGCPTYWLLGTSPASKLTSFGC